MIWTNLSTVVLAVGAGFTTRKTYPLVTLVTQVSAIDMLLNLLLGLNTVLRMKCIMQFGLL